MSRLDFIPSTEEASALRVLSGLSFEELTLLLKLHPGATEEVVMECTFVDAKHWMGTRLHVWTIHSAGFNPNDKRSYVARVGDDVGVDLQDVLSQLEKGHAST